MRILYILPHPDDESFGPAPVIARYLRDGHQVCLLTLTRGGATKQRHKLGLSVEEMGKVRLAEMQDVEQTLGLSSMTVLDLKDSGLKEMDPRILENIIWEHVETVKPDLLVTYPVHGVSGFYDHLVCHAVVKRVFVEMKEKLGFPKRLAFFGVDEASSKNSTHFKLNAFTKEEIDCIITVEAKDIAKGREALLCYKTYRETIDNVGIENLAAKINPFEFFNESFDPPVTDLLDKLPG